MAGIDIARRLRHQVNAPIVFRERHHFADGFFAGDQHDDAVEPKRNAAMGRSAETKSAEDMAEERFLRFLTHPKRREYFRLPYPITSGATLVVDGTNYKVGELSERGLRVITGVGQFPVDSQVEGTLALTMGVRCQVSGTVLRIEDDAFVVKLDRGPSTRDVMREQLHLSKTFPDWKPLPA